MNKNKLAIVNLIETNKKEIILIIGILLLCVIILSPLLKSGFVGDDAINSFTKGHLLESNTKVGAFTAKIFNDWLHVGRFYPLANWTYFMFSVISSVFVYKIIILTFVIINLILFYFFVLQLTNSKPIALVSLSLMPILFQFRIYHDPILSFGLLLQVIFIYTFSSLLLLLLYVKYDKRYFYILSLLFYASSLFTYEITYSFFILHFIILYFMKGKQIKKTLKESAPFIGLSILSLLISIGIRIYFKIPISGENYGAYVPNLNIIIFLKTYIKQVSAALPLSYYISDPINVLSGPLDFLITSPKKSLLIIISYLVITLSISKRVVKEKFIQKSSLLMISLTGAMILLLPGLLTSLSTRYQEQVMIGVGYLPVYISYYGTALILAMLIVLVYQRVAKVNNYLIYIVSIVIWLILSFAGIMNYNSNRVVVDNMNVGWLYPRVIIENALNNGLFKLLPKNSIILIDSAYAWDASPFYFLHSRKRVKYIGVKGTYDFTIIDNKKIPYDKPTELNYKLNDNVYYLRYISSEAGKGLALLGKVKRLTGSTKEIKDVNLYSGLIYDDFISISNEPTELVIKRIGLDSNLSPNLDFKNKLNYQQLNDNWIIYSFD